MSPAAYAARLRIAVAAYEADPRPSSWQLVTRRAAAIRRCWPSVLLLLPLPPPLPPKFANRGRPRKTASFTPQPETK